jgi:hypothetical protein
MACGKGTCALGLRLTRRRSRATNGARVEADEVGRRYPMFRIAITVEASYLAICSTSPRTRLCGPSIVGTTTA